MKLLRWTLAGASFYIVYKYTIGKKTDGEKVFTALDGPTDLSPAVKDDVVAQPIV